MLTSQNSSRATSASITPDSHGLDGHGLDRSGPDCLGEVRWHDESTAQFGAIPIYSSKCTIGSDTNCTVVLPATGVASVHASLVFGKRFILLKALAPTYQSGRTLKESLIDRGTVVTVGTIRIEILPKHEIGRITRSPKVIRASDVRDHANILSPSIASSGLDVTIPPATRILPDTNTEPQKIETPTTESTVASSSAKSEMGSDSTPNLTEKRLVAIEETLEKLQTAVDTIQTPLHTSDVPTSVDLSQQIAAIGQTLTHELDQRLVAIIEAQANSQAALVGQIREEALRPLESTIENLAARIDDLSYQSTNTSERLDSLAASTESQFAQWNHWRDGLLTEVDSRYDVPDSDVLAPRNDQGDPHAVDSETYAPKETHSPASINPYLAPQDYVEDASNYNEFETPLQDIATWAPAPEVGTNSWDQLQLYPEMPSDSPCNQSESQELVYEESPHVTHGDNSPPVASSEWPSYSHEDLSQFDSNYEQPISGFGESILNSEPTQEAIHEPNANHFSSETNQWQTTSAEPYAEHGPGETFDVVNPQPYQSYFDNPYQPANIESEPKSFEIEPSSPLAAYLRHPNSYESNVDDRSPREDSATGLYDNQDSESKVDQIYEDSSGVHHSSNEDWRDEEPYRVPTSDLSIRLRQMLAEIKASEENQSVDVDHIAIEDHRSSDPDSVPAYQDYSSINYEQSDALNFSPSDGTSSHCLSYATNTEESEESGPTTATQFSEPGWDDRNTLDSSPQNSVHSTIDDPLSDQPGFDWNKGSLFEPNDVDAIDDLREEEPPTQDEEPTLQQRSTPIDQSLQDNTTVPPSEDREESIEEYMQKLLQRVKQGPDVLTPNLEDLAIKPAPRSRGEFINRATKQPESEGNKANNPVVRSEPISESLRRSASPAVDMNALRELANSNARRAIARSETKRASTTILIKVAITSFAIAAAALILLLNGVNTKPPFAGFIAAVIVAFLWGSDCYKHFRALKVSKSEKPVTRELEPAEPSSVRTGEEADGWRPSPV